MSVDEHAAYCTISTNSQDVTRDARERVTEHLVEMVWQYTPVLILILKIKRDE